MLRLRADPGLLPASHALTEHIAYDTLCWHQEEVLALHLLRTSEAHVDGHANNPNHPRSVLYSHTL